MGSDTGRGKMDWQTDFVVPIVVNIIGVFVGVVLALWTNRRAEAYADAKEARRSAKEFAELREVVLASVVKATIEATQVKTALASRNDPYLLEVYFELAVWEAAQSEFVTHAPLEDRILLSRFFDQVRRLSRLVDFYRRTRTKRGGGQANDPAFTTDKLATDNIATHLAELAEDVRLDGIVIVTDHGDEVQRRCLGL